MNIPLYYTLKQCDEVTVANFSMPYIKSLYSCLNRVVGDGYTDEFKKDGQGIKSKKTNRVYFTGEVKIVNFFRFEGNTNPDDNVIMYIIETAVPAEGGDRGSSGLPPGHRELIGNDDPPRGATRGVGPVTATAGSEEQVGEVGVTQLPQPKATWCSYHQVSVENSGPPPACR
jgi:hypothetical protein